MTALRRAMIAAALLAAACARDSKRQFPGAPVILVSVDTLRSDHLPAYGYRNVQTPNLDALRRDSILYARVWSHCPMTLPSHVSMLTGLLPTEHHVRNNLGYRFDGSKFRTLAEELRDRGYATAATVSSYVLRSDTGMDDGFDFYEDSIPVATAGAASEHQRSGDETLKYALKWIEQNRDRPFFLFFHIYEPHAPYLPTYDGEIAASDAITGRLIQSLKNWDLYDRSIIIFTSDHGEGLWEHGEDQHGILLYREALQVPLLIKLPQSDRGGSTVGDLVPLSDLFSIILELVGARERRPMKTAIYAETLYPRIHLGWSELRSLISDRYHYIEGPKPELYDLQRDPGETNNIIAVERRIAATMRRELQSYPAAIPALGPVDPEDAKKLAALGYIGTPRDRAAGPLPNPRDEVKNLDRIKAAFRLADERRLGEATAAFRALLQNNPRLLDVWSKLGEVLVESARYDEAIDTYKSAIAQSERFSPDLALSLGFAYLKRGNASEAASHAQLALKSNPREANELLARAALEQRRFREAEEHGRIALHQGDRQPATLLLLADIQRNATNLEAALRTVEQAEQRAAELGVPRLQGADFLRGDILARLDRPDEAVAAYQREVTNFPQHLQAYANLAVIHLIQGRVADANEILQQMARNNPHRGAYLLAAKTLEAFDDRKGAARWRQRAAP